MKKFFSPKAVAVIGASRDRKKVGNVIFRNLLESNITTFPVNKNATKVEGKRTYSSVLDIKKKIDLAIIAIPAKFIQKVMEELGAKRVKNAIIISAGFSESGEKENEARISDVAKKYGIKIIGPNCLGIIDTHKNINASFFDGMPKKGNTAFISQSGALGVAVLDWAIKENWGLSKFISLGNMINTNFSDILEYLENDKSTERIILYIESLKEGKRFLEIAKRITKKKTIIALKAGTSEKGKKAAMSHTGAIAGSEKVYSGAFKQAGILRVKKITDAFEIARMKTFPKGKGVLIITNAGGPGVLATDFAENFELDIVNLPTSVKNILDDKLPYGWSGGNPIDIIGDALAKRYSDVFTTIEKNNFYDSVLVILTPQAMTESEQTAMEIIKFQKRIKKPVFACFMGGEKVERAKLLLDKNNVPVFDEPYLALEILSISSLHLQ